MSDRLRYALVGCMQRTYVWSAMLKAALVALKLPHGVRVVEDDDDAEFRRVIEKLRSGEYAGVHLFGARRYDALEVSDDVDVSARRAKSVSTLVRTSDGRLAGANVEVLGIIEHFKRMELRPRTAVLVGAGTQGMAAAAACEALGVQVIVATSRSWTTTETLYQSAGADRMRELRVLTALWPAAVGEAGSSRFSDVMRLQFADLAAGADLIVQATPATLEDSEESNEVLRAVPWPRVKRDAVVCDLVCRIDPSLFLKTAQQMGLTTVAGFAMIAEQGVRTVEMWTGLRAPLTLLQAAAERATAELNR